MKSISLVSGLLFCATLLAAQYKYDYNWVFGFDFNDTLEGFILRFNESPLQIEQVQLEMTIQKSNASMSDASGNLLFYTNGCDIADATHAIMENGDNINAGEVHEIQCVFGTGYTSGTQSCLALPLPGNPNLYYLFHKHIVYWSDPWDVATDAILYTVVDRNGNNGLGSVILKDQVALEDTLAFGEMTAVKHANGKDWWIITHQWRKSDKFYQLLFTADGIASVMEQQIGIPSLTDGSGSSQTAFSPDGTRFARVNVADQLWLFDFDRQTGELSNFRYIWLDSLPGVVGCAFSPNSRFLYVNTRNYLYQFDMEASDIAASKILIDTWDGYSDPLPAAFYRMQPGPDCRIYINSTNSVKVLHVIREPDQPGKACQFVQHDLKLPTQHLISIPHFPNYRLGTEYPVCDSNLAVSVQPVLFRPEVVLFPNPVRTGQVRYASSLPLSDEATILLYGLDGRFLRRWSIAPGQQEAVFSLEGVSGGMYFWSIKVHGKIMKSGKLVVMD